MKVAQIIVDDQPAESFSWNDTLVTNNALLTQFNIISYAQSVYGEKKNVRVEFSNLTKLKELNPLNRR